MAHASVNLDMSYTISHAQLIRFQVNNNDWGTGALDSPSEQLRKGNDGVTAIRITLAVKSAIVDTFCIEIEAFEVF